ncbi:MAG TPA: hypothetical protein PLX89_24205 [Verrucomicrobiota bacterium]|nr:hypothetical protein [Verrucomicrobiota bacterium]
MKHTLLVVLAIIAVLVGLGFIMPAVAKWRAFGGMAGSDFALLMLGVVLTLGGLATALRPLFRRSH